MLYAEFKIPVKGVYQTFMAGQCLKGNGIDKIHSIFVISTWTLAPCFTRALARFAIL